MSKRSRLWKKDGHSVFFNRGVASSQAYAVKFGNKKPKDVKGGKAYIWLSRGLKEALVKFISDSVKGDELIGCFYEFRYKDILLEFKKAALRGVKIRIIYDAKENKPKNPKKGEKAESFPRDENEKCITDAKLREARNVELIPRTVNKSYICHNKFLVLVRNKKPGMVWTGSTNISEGGIFGQTNVGHSVCDSTAAKKFIEYWNAMYDIKDTDDYKEKIESIQGDIAKVDSIKSGITCIFSPRKSLKMLEFYAKLLVSAEDCACITLAFGVNKTLMQQLMKNTEKSALTFLMLEKDEENIAEYSFKNNIVKAVGSYMRKDLLSRWTKEVTTQNLKLTQRQ